MSGQKNKMQKSFGPQNFDYKKFYPKSFVKIRSVTADIFLIWTNVARTNNFFVGKTFFFSRNSWNMFKMVPGSYLESLVKIGSVTAEIFLIWTNVARTNIAWTDVTVTVGICS